MTLRSTLVNGGAILATLMFSSATVAQTTYPLGGGTVTYTGPAPQSQFYGYDIEADAPNVTVSGVNLAPGAGSFAGLFIERSTDTGSIAVSFNGNASSVISDTSDALDVYHTGPTTTGDILLDTSGTGSGNTFKGGVGGSYGSGIDVEGDALASNVTIITGADTISGPSSGVQAYAAGTFSLTTAANISGGTQGVDARGWTTNVSLTGNASVSGSDGMDLYSGHGPGTVTVAQGASITGLGNIADTNLGNPFIPPGGNGYGILSAGGQAIVNRGTITGVSAGIFINSYTNETCINPGGCTLMNPTSPSSITNSGTISGVTASVQFAGPGANTLTLQSGSTLIGAAIGSSDAAATNALVLEGHGTANNNFVNFNSLTVQNGAGTWTLGGSSTFSGNLSTNAGTALIFNGGANSFQNINNSGSIFVTGGTLTAGGTFTNTGLVVATGSGTKVNFGTYSQTGSGTRTRLNGVTFDPASINIQDGAFGGDGTVIGNVSVTGGEIDAGNEPGGALKIQGGYSQTGGKLVFQIGSNGSGGFLESSLVFTPGDPLSLKDTAIVFDFLDGADPLAFFNSGDFDIDSFFQSSDGTPFSGAFDSSVFQDDTFDITSADDIVTDFDFSPETGAAALSEITKAPEPISLSLFGAGLAGAAAMRRRRAKT